ncbi:MAG: XRE family transcriptional regulator, partial [Methylococcus sp.]
MAITLEDKMAALPPERRQQVEAMTAMLVAEEKSLKDLRQAMALTQERLAELLDIRQESISRIEKRHDLLLSTLQSYVKAMGGQLRLVAEFPGRPPVILKGLEAMGSEPMDGAFKKRDPTDK